MILLLCVLIAPALAAVFDTGLYNFATENMGLERTNQSIVVDLPVQVIPSEIKNNVSPPQWVSSWSELEYGV